MPKNLPIQKVQFRGVRDQFLTEGGGSNKLPQWVTEDAISINVANVSGQMAQFGRLFDENRSLPVLFNVKIHEKATAKSHRPSIRSILDTRNKQNVIGVSSVGNLIAKIDNRRDLQTIQQRFTQTNNSRKRRIGLAAIEQIEPFDAYVEPDVENATFVKIQLIDYQNREYNHTSHVQLEVFCKSKGIRLERLNYASTLRLYSAKNITPETIKAIARMDSVLAIKKMPMIVFENAPVPDNSQIEVMRPSQNGTYPLVGVLDTGISSTMEYLSPWLQNEEYNSAGLEEQDIDRSHGTAVASVLNYGDLLEKEDLTKCGPCRIKSCIVNTSRTTIYESELVSNIQNAVLSHPNIKIWNLSQGTNTEISDDNFSHLGIALDNLQKDNKILICKSAGNINGNTDERTQRITKGADSLLSLVVGSITHKKNTNNDADVHDRSPFSRIGPGVENTIKPDLVHFGGNTDSHLFLFSQWGREFCGMSGTSFSTPRVTSLAANLQHSIGGDFNPLLIKALIVHNADYPIEINKPYDELRREMGFGLPATIDEMLHNDEYECTMVFSHTLEKGTDIVSLDFPYPQSLVDADGYYVGDLTVTLAVCPILDASQGSEYCQSQVDVLLETFDHVENVQLGQGLMRNENRMSSDSVNVLKKDLYGKKSIESKSNQERTLIEHGYKYQPIKKYHVDLSKMTLANKRKALTSSKKWALKLVGLYREAAEMSMIKDGCALSQEVIVIVTIKDNSKRSNIYLECMRLLQQRGYVHNNINSENRLQIHSNQ